MTDERTRMVAHLDRRRGLHDRLATRLAALSDDELAALAPETGSWRASVHGNQSGVIEFEGARVFVKRIALTDLERTVWNEGATANLFDLPMFYHYGVGSAGFGAWRELQAYLKASAWVRSGEQPYFPLVYHWRVLPRTPLLFSDQQRAWLDRAPSYWDHSEAVRARLEAIAAASASVVLFLEHVPQSLHAWRKDRLTGQDVDAGLEATILRLLDQWQGAAAFMNDHGMLHFDLNADNVLTDGEQVYVADFGLAICEDFDLAPAERAFVESHRLYDACYVAWAFADWLAPRSDPPVLTPGLSARIGRYDPVAKIFLKFIRTLSEESKTAPYPATELEAAFRRLRHADLAAEAKDVLL